jgi:hypothetical protein
MEVEVRAERDDALEVDDDALVVDTMPCLTRQVAGEVFGGMGEPR